MLPRAQRLSFLQDYDIMMTSVPREAESQIGKVGKRTHLIKLSYRAIRSKLDDTWPNGCVLALAVTARNTAPLSVSGFTPIFLITGAIFTCMETKRVVLMGLGAIIGVKNMFSLTARKQSVMIVLS